MAIQASNFEATFSLPLEAKILMDNLAEKDNAQKLSEMVVKSIKLRARQLHIKQLQEEVNEARKDESYLKMLQEEENWENDID